MAIKYTNFLHYIQNPRKFTQIGIFGLKICHLATLEQTRVEAEKFHFKMWLGCGQGDSIAAFKSSVYCKKVLPGRQKGLKFIASRDL
jgi:hypothetical protein